MNTASIQIARMLGATVYVVGSGARESWLWRSRGARPDRPLKRSGLVEGGLELSEKRGVDMVVDNVGTTFPLSFRAAGEGRAHPDRGQHGRTEIRDR